MELWAVFITLVRHTLQQGDVVPFQHDPPCERTENKRGRNCGSLKEIRQLMYGSLFKLPKIE